MHIVRWKVIIYCMREHKPAQTLKDIVKLWEKFKLSFFQRKEAKVSGERKEWEKNSFEKKYIIRVKGKLIGWRMERRKGNWDGNEIISEYNGKW